MSVEFAGAGERLEALADLVVDHGLALIRGEQLALTTPTTRSEP